jgi:hypothetical protein
MSLGLAIEFRSENCPRGFAAEDSNAEFCQKYLALWKSVPERAHLRAERRRSIMPLPDRYPGHLNLLLPALPALQYVIAGAGGVAAGFQPSRRRLKFRRRLCFWLHR